MKLKKSKQLYSLVITLLVGVGMMSHGTTAIAQDCVGYANQSKGNLLGYITVSGLPSYNQNNYIWVSSEDDPWEEGPDYGVTYDRDTGVLSGRGWNEGLRVWVDFDEAVDSDEAQVVDSDGQPVGGFQWGYWEGRIRGLDNLTYSNNQGAFTPKGTEDADIDGDGTTDFTYTWPYDAQYVSGNSAGDVIVGMGELSFENVVFDPSTVPSECQEYIDVLANGRSSLHLSTCGPEVELTWNSQNIEPTTCSTVSNGAPWVSPGPRQISNLSGETTGAIDEENSPANFTLECIGEISGNTVRGLARVSCGEETDTENNFEYIES